MVNIHVLCTELSLDAIGLVMGTIVLIRSSDNKLQRAWGFLAITLSILLLLDNTEWVYLYGKGGKGLPDRAILLLDHLSLWHIVRTVIFFQFFSLFPLASLKPGWLTLSRITNFCIPIILITCIACCYELFNGQYTKLRSFSDIIKHIDKQDVILRIFLFIVSVITPSVNFLFLFFKRWIPYRRKQNHSTIIYMSCFGLIMSGYIWLMLGTSGLSFNIFGYLVIIPMIYLNRLYLRNENPLSLPPNPAEQLKSENAEVVREMEASVTVLELNNQLQSLMKEQKPFINPEYSLSDLLGEMNTNEHRLTNVLRYNGFSGFREYINFIRLQYFKEQAALHKDSTVKELMFKSGFTSRSSFYRYFSSIEKMSPTEYIEKLKE